MSQDQFTDRVSSWRSRAAILVAHPWRLWALMIALNGLFSPYQSLFHDARLYAVQVQNHIEGGAYNDDLFFRFGSQDRYSAFSVVAAPLVETVGIQWAFALIYLFGIGLQLFAMSRLIRRLVSDPLAAVLACVVMAAFPLPVGGMDIFHVVEPYCTPRGMAVACSILAMDAALTGRWLQTAGWLAAAFSLHPLMAFGAFLWIAGYWLANSRRPNWVWVGIAGIAVAVVVVLAVPSLGFRYLGRFDAEWDRWVRETNEYNYVSEWRPADWLRVAITAGVLWFTAKQIESLRRIAWLTLGLLVLAVGGTSVAEVLPYALPIQGQPYRALWVVQLLAVPLGFSLVARWSAYPELWPRAFAILLAAWLCIQTMGLNDWLMMVGLGLGFAWLNRARSPARGMAVGIAIAALLFPWPIVLLMIRNWSLFTEVEISMRVVVGLMATVPLVRWLIIRALLPWATCSRVVFPILAVGYWLGITWAFGPGSASGWLSGWNPTLADRHFLREELDRRKGLARPCVYWCGARIDWMWLDLSALSYAQEHQLSGVIFHRGTAELGLWRRQRIRPFETAYVISGWPAQVPPPGTPNLPTFSDLVKLCEDPELDWVILPENFPEGHPVTNGKVYLYDAARIRAEQNRR